MMTPHPTEEELFEMHAETLQGPRHKEVHVHPQSCQECQIVIQDYQQIETSYKKQTWDMPSASVLSRIQKKAESAGGSKAAFFLFFNPRTAGLLAVLVMAAGLAIYEGYGPQKIREESSLSVSAPPKIAPSISPTPPTIPTREISFGGATTTTSPAKFRFEALEKESPAPFGDLMLADTGSAEGAQDEEAEIDREEARDTASAGANDLFDQGLLFAGQKRFREATAIFEILWATEPSFPEKDKLLYHWAQCLHQLGKKSEALEKLNILSTANPNYPGLSQLRESID